MLVEEEKAAEESEEETTPDEIEVFRLQYGIEGSYTCTLKKIVDAKQVVLFHYPGRVPTINEVGEEHGPGEYILSFFWRIRSPDDRRKKIPQAKSFEFQIGENWRSRHLKWARKQAEQETEERRRDLQRRKEDAELHSIESGGNGKGGDPLESLKNAAGTLRELGVQIGGGQKQEINWEKILTGAASVAAIVTPIVQQLFGGGGGKDRLMEVMLANQENTTKLMLGFLTSQGPNAQMEMMRKAYDTSIELIKDGASTKAGLLAPPEKESILQQIVGFIDRAGPSIMEMVAQSSAQRKQNPLYQQVASHPAMQKVAASPDLQKEMIERLDKEFGFQNTEDILKAWGDLGIKRPESLRENFRKYPSDGFDREGEAVQDTPEEESPLKAEPGPPELPEAPG